MEKNKAGRKKINLGSHFGDYVSTEDNPFIQHSGEKTEALIIVRLIIIVVIFVSSFILLVGRLFYLTVVRGAYYQDLSSNNRIREIILPAPRGVIYAATGEVLARNKPIYRECSGINGPCHFINREVALEKESRGENVDVALGREYPEGERTAHIVGYVSQIGKDDLVSRNTQLQQQAVNFCSRCYQPDDWIGVTGVENSFEGTLRGSSGRELIEVTATHDKRKELAKIDPVPGTNIHLALRLYLVEKAAVLLSGKKGAIIASNPATGEIYAMYSSPSFDPNVFVGETNDTIIVNNLFTNNDKPLFNRAISGLYPPGSTFKIVTAAAGLAEGKIDADTTVLDTGVLTVGPYSYANWYFTQYGKTEGEISIVRALARSNDLFFYKVGELVGENKLAAWANRFGFGETAALDIPGEEKGIVIRDRQWYLGDTYHLAIGQGDLLTTPLQINTMTATIANGGKKCKPTVLQVQQHGECNDIGLNKKTVALITEGMKEVCAEGGTAYPLFNFSINNVAIPVACKTGTAEYGDPENKTHAWITAFAPAKDPQIAVTVLVESAGEGSSVAGPMLKELLTEWFSHGQ